MKCIQKEDATLLLILTLLIFINYWWVPETISGIISSFSNSSGEAP